MFMRMIYDDKLAAAAYLIGCQRTGEAIVIDPERDVDRYERLAAANGLRIVAAAETHIHADFISGSRELAEKGTSLLNLRRFAQCRLGVAQTHQALEPLHCHPPFGVILPHGCFTSGIPLCLRVVDWQPAHFGEFARS
jgi:glyoxylase-like metal-dependent hydrolase (beta-lactamase superfamily II)